MTKKPHARSIFAVAFISLLVLAALAGVQSGESESISSYEEQAVSAAYFHWQYTNGTEIAFTAYGPDSANYTWSFGNDSMGYGKTVTHAFQPGTAAVTLTTIHAGDGASNTRTISVSDDPPVADFTWEPETPTTQTEVQFWDESVDPHQEIRNWTWQFGDGTVSYLRDPVHTFADNGIYNVQLAIYDANDTCLDSVTKQVYVFNVPPTANFYWTKEHDAIRFNGSYSTDDGAISAWEWSFGDGNGSYVQNPSHIYQEDGTYQVTLQVTDDDGETSEVTKTVDTTNDLPGAAAFIDPLEATIKTDVVFNDISTDNDGSIVNRTWNLGDGTTSHARNLTHRYSAKDTYTVTLTVIDSGHAYNTTTREVAVINLPPDAIFSWMPTYPAVNEAVTFVNYSIGPGGIRRNTTDLDGTVTNQTWIIDNTTVGYGPTLTHTFTASGTHTVTFRVTDDSGDVNQTTHTVHVADIYVDDDQSPGWYDHTHVRTIQEGVINASAGSLIYVLEGTYQEQVLVNKNVTITGDNATVDGDGGTAFTVSANSVVLHEFAVTGASRAVNVSADSVTVTRCTVSDFAPSGDGVHVQGGYARIMENTFQGPGTGAGAAVRVTGPYAHVAYNTFTGVTDGVALVNGSDHTVEANHFTDAISAVRVTHAENCSITGNTFTGNNPYAVDVAAAGCSIADNTFHDNGRAVTLRSNDALVRNNTLTGNTVGIEVTGTDNAITQATFTDNDRAIVLTSSSGTRISSCDLSGNTVGIEAYDSGRYAVTQIYNVDVSATAADAVILHDTEAYLSRCTFTGHTRGIYVNDSANVRIQSCTFTDGDTGISIHGAGPSVTGCTISSHATAIVSSGHDTSIASSRFHNNTLALLMQGEDGAITGCTIQDNMYGIAVHDAHRLTVTTSTLSGNTHGMSAENDTDTAIQNTSFANNTNAVALNGSHAAVIADSMIADSETALALTDATNCRVQHSHLRRNMLAVTVLSGMHTHLDGNNLSGNHIALRLFRAPENVLDNNSFMDNDYAIDLEGSTVSQYHQDIDDSNTVNGRPVYYITDTSDVNWSAVAPEDGRYGYLAFVSCHNVTITSAVTEPNGEGLLLADVHTFTVTGSTFANSRDGAVLFSSSNGSIMSSTCSDNAGDGVIMTSGTHNVSITACTITGNGQRGINLYRSTGGAGHVHIADSDVTDNWLGVNIENTGSNTLENLTLSGSQNVAIRLYKSDDIHVGNTTLHDNTDGLEIARSSAMLYNLSMWGHNTAITATDGTIDMQGGHLHDNDVGAAATRATVTVAGATLYNHSTGIMADDNTTVYLGGVVLDASDHALHVMFSNVAVEGCTVTNNTHGILLDHAHASIANCTNGGTIANNIYGVTVNHSTDVMLTGCSFHDNENAVTVTASNGTTIDGCVVYNNTDALLVSDANDTSITGSLLHHNVNALDIHADNTTVVRCSFWKNMYGVRIMDGRFNDIYHNNFAYNMEQASDAGANNSWDDGYPTGGNYWSDYAGTDHRRGPAQNQSGSDGIGDIPYPIADGSAADSYPLMDMVENAAAIPNSPPVAAFFIYPAQPLSDEPVDYVDRSSDPNGNSDIAEWLWDFGDGNTSSRQHPSHTYARPGNYTVMLTVTDSQNASSTHETTITVSNTPPEARFTMSPSEAAIDETVQFTDGSTDGNGAVVSWNWTFGDGATSSQQNPSHAYSTAGTYTVTLQVTDDDGATDTTSLEIKVSGTRPTAAFSAIPSKPGAGEPVAFTDLSTDDSVIETWHWDFGDGNASAAQNPSHTYEKAGTYTVTLTIWDDDGAKNTTTKTITVTDDNDTPGFAMPLLLLALAVACLALRRRRGKV